MSLANEGTKRLAYCKSSLQKLFWAFKIKKLNKNFPIEKIYRNLKIIFP